MLRSRVFLLSSRRLIFLWFGTVHERSAFGADTASALKFHHEIENNQHKGKNRQSGH